MYERLLCADRGLKVENCRNPDCKTYPTDIFCDHLIFLPHVRMRWIVVACLAIYAAFPFSAETGSMLPIFVAGCLLGGAVVVLPLFRNRATWTVALAGWVVASAIALGVHFSSGVARQPALLLLAVLTASAWLHLLWRNFDMDAVNFGQPELIAEGLTTHYTPQPKWKQLIELKLRKVSRFVAAVLGFGLFLLTVDVALTFLRLSEGVQEPWPYMGWLLRAGIGAIASGVAVSVISGTLFQKGIISPRKKAKPIPVKMSDRLPRRKPIASLFGKIRESLLRVATVIEVTFENTRSVIGYVIAVVMDSIRDSVKASAVVAAKILKAGTSSALKATRYSIVPVVGLGLASWLTICASKLEMQYLSRGTGASVIAAATVGFLGVLCLTVTWVALSAKSVGECLQSATSSAVHAAGYILIFVVVGCWLVALPSTFLGGEIRIGWITWVTTVLVALFLIWAKVKEQAND